MIHSKFDPSKKLAPLLRQAFRQGVAAATRNDSHNPYVRDSHFYHAWIAGWAMVARSWGEADVLHGARRWQNAYVQPEVYRREC
jgi:hypothetical protein